MFGYVIVAVMFWFVGDVVDNVIVGFVIFTVMFGEPLLCPLPLVDRE